MADYTVTKDGITFVVTFKNMKNLRMRIMPDGTVAVSAPFRTSKERVDKFINDGVSWVKEQKEKIAQAHPERPQSPYEPLKFIYHLGKKLPVVHYELPMNKVVLTDTEVQVYSLDMPRRDVLTSAIKQVQRNIFQRMLPLLTVACEGVCKVKANEWRIRSMKTKWGTCNRTEKRIWLRLELISYPPDCIKAVMVHELTHLHEAGHTKRFYELMNSFYPENAEPNRILDEGRYDWW